MLFCSLIGRISGQLRRSSSGSSDTTDWKEWLHRLVRAFWESWDDSWDYCILILGDQPEAELAEGCQSRKENIEEMAIWFGTKLETRERLERRCNLSNQIDSMLYDNGHVVLVLFRRKQHGQLIPKSSSVEIQGDMRPILVLCSGIDIDLTWYCTKFGLPRSHGLSWSSWRSNDGKVKKDCNLRSLSDGKL